MSKTLVLARLDRPRHEDEFPVLQARLQQCGAHLRTICRGAACERRDRYILAEAESVLGVFCYLLPGGARDRRETNVGPEHSLEIDFEPVHFLARQETRMRDRDHVIDERGDGHSA